MNFVLYTIPDAEYLLKIFPVAIKKAKRYNKSAIILLTVIFKTNYVTKSLIAHRYQRLDRVYFQADQPFIDQALRHCIRNTCRGTTRLKCIACWTRTVEVRRKSCFSK